MNNEFYVSRSMQKKINMSIRAGLQNDMYPDLVEYLINEKYNVKQELAIHRQKDVKPLEWEEYNTYCENAKTYAKELLGLN